MSPAVSGSVDALAVIQIRLADATKHSWSHRRENFVVLAANFSCFGAIS